jgi:hypothetical protein
MKLSLKDKILIGFWIGCILGFVIMSILVIMEII